MSWETIGVFAMIAFFMIIGWIEGRKRFGEARFDSETGKVKDDE